jgi:hypothetical protein
VDSRVVLKAPDGTLTPVLCEVLVGKWWSDNWITPVLQLRLGGLPPVAAVVVSGYGPGFAPRQIENGIRVSAGAAQVERSVEWGRVFEATLALDRAAEGSLTLDLATQEGLGPDGLDGRERGVIVTRLIVQAVAA